MLSQVWIDGEPVGEVDALSTFDVQRVLELAVTASSTVRFRVRRARVQVNGRLSHFLSF